ncbi:TetR/AcrR family transcriptional regulator [Actinomadura algeriensis]|uniref:AcrR family transcriptional regulator n=1 Tax=Actinomadura algeriensis TaxID=1679523 RepID=A0ABR9JYJ9_9ACTN|nr:helix-turn-helix domain-containing protein [Actinomadura algeriensis]MBE1535662.1 AcrR family transcriptional regulator [Actinomadura algeriensis]
MDRAPRRADARRNRERVMRAALEAFAADGRLVPLDEIARRAGVGAGTVYRNFATKEALFETVVTERIRAMVERAETLRTAGDPGTVFYDYLAHVVEAAMVNHALCEALIEEGAGTLNRECMDSAFMEALDVLLRRAVEAGSVRDDVDVHDVRTLVTGCMLMERLRRAAVPSGRITALAFDALRPRAVTKPSDETKVSRNVCEMCGDPLTAARTGRPARYCGPACRQKAHRRRARA